MAVILSLETATRNCSVGLSDNGQTIALNEFAGEGYGHAEKLHLFIQQVFDKAGLSFKDLDAVAVSRGPGSYTGLRIGVSAAKGLCLALDKPLISVNTLQILASHAKGVSGTIIPMIDARRMEVYCAAFDAQLNPLSAVEAKILDSGSFAELPGPLFFTGDSSEKAKTVLAESRFHFLDDAVFPSASHMGSLANDKFLKGDFEDLAYFEPYYLKDFRVG